MTGVRLAGGEPNPWPPPNGSYWRMKQRGGDNQWTWYALTPNGLLACLANHTIVDHEDSTITVSPSILVTGHNGLWHGFLERGIWREC